MDQSVKTLVNVIVLFVGLLLLMSCISFFLVSSKARSTLYSVIQHVEVYGYDSSVINQYAKDSHTQIQVTPLDITPVTGYRYRVEVTFHHVFAWLNLNKNVTYSSITRVVQY